MLGLACDVTCEDWRALGSMSVRARAGNFPSIGIWTCAKITKGGRLCSPTISSLPCTTRMHRGSSTNFSLVFTSRDRPWGVGSSRRGLVGFCSSLCLAPCWGGCYTQYPMYQLIYNPHNTSHPTWPVDQYLKSNTTKPVSFQLGQQVVN